LVYPPAEVGRDAVELIETLVLRLPMRLDGEMPLAEYRCRITGVAQHLSHRDFRRREGTMTAAFHDGQ